MKGVLFASFGTTHDDARERAIDAAADAVARRFADATLHQAYTSGMIRRTLSKRGVEIPDVESALRSMADSGATEVLVSVGHVLPGEEYDKVRAAVDMCCGLFSSIELATPLVSGSDDLDEIASVMSKRYPKKDSSAVILMGHGTPTFANIVYAALGYHLANMGRSDIAVATVEGYPTLDEAMAQIAKTGAKSVTLAPLMLVAGDHAVNDMAGDDEDSWANILHRNGYNVECDLTGMGEIEGIRSMYVAHAETAATRLGWL